MSNSALPQKQEWAALRRHIDSLRSSSSLKDLFKNDPNRFQDFSTSMDGLFFDYSKQFVTSETIDLLLKLARASDLEAWRARMFDGDEINSSEGRAVLHTALRGGPCPAPEVVSFVRERLTQMQAFSDAVRDGTLTGATGQAFRHIVHIGIGGSDLGPRLVCDALKPFQNTDIRVHFVSNIDGADLQQVLDLVDPETTLFLVASKTFTTVETMTNALSARDWLAGALNDPNAAAVHFCAITENESAARDFGIEADRIFLFRDWVGGRFSLWSTIGLPIALFLGFDAFRRLLDGAHAMDRHFRDTPFHQNIPVLMGLVGIWNRNFLGADSLAILPYAQNLAYLPSYLQQLEMESNGKSVDRDGRSIDDYGTAPVLFGQPGTNGQHAFYQMLHQGTTVVPCDFIGIIKPEHALPRHHSLLLNNMLAQAQALMTGRDHNDPNLFFAGNRPSTTLLLDRLDPYHLGLLIALYEHKVFVQGVVWNINSFDQFGVQLGKELAKNIENGVDTDMDASTHGLLRVIHAKSKE